MKIIYIACVLVALVMLTSDLELNRSCGTPLILSGYPEDAFNILFVPYDYPYYDDQNDTDLHNVLTENALAFFMSSRVFQKHPINFFYLYNERNSELNLTSWNTSGYNLYEVAHDHIKKELPTCPVDNIIVVFPPEHHIPDYPHAGLGWPKMAFSMCMDRNGHISDCVHEFGHSVGMFHPHDCWEYGENDTDHLPTCWKGNSTFEEPDLMGYAHWNLNYTNVSHPLVFSTIHEEFLDSYFYSFFMDKDINNN